MKNLKFINKIKKAGETGRSMVEMLGVLAIIGVITVGGLAGYNYGMNRYRTNEILDGGTKRAYTVSTQITTDIPVNLSEFVDYNETAGGTFDSNVELWQNEFGLKVSGVKKEVCENLIRMIGNNTPIRAVVNADAEDGYEENMTIDDCADGNNNNLLLVYNYEMLSNDAATSGSRESGGGSGESCWVTGTCGPDDVDPTYEEYCNGGIHAKNAYFGPSYCYCFEATGGDLTSGCFGVSKDDIYISCKEEGKSSQCCDCYLEYPNPTGRAEYCAAYCGEGCAGGAAPINKTYYTGTCCDVSTSGSFCPEENPPSCVKELSCCTDYIVGTECCTDGPHTSKACCEDSSAPWHVAYSHWNGSSCE